MSNLYSGALNFSGYKTVTELTGITFTENSKYVIQVKGECYLREGETGNGFYINNVNPIEYTAGADDLYIYNPISTPLIINIAEG